MTSLYHLSISSLVGMWVLPRPVFSFPAGVLSLLS